MSDLTRYGLPLAVLIAAAATCLFLLFAPTASTPSADQITGHVQVNPVINVPHEPHAGEAVTTDA